MKFYKIKNTIYILGNISAIFRNFDGFYRILKKLFSTKTDLSWDFKELNLICRT